MNLDVLKRIPDVSQAEALSRRWNAGNIWPQLGILYLNFPSEKGTVYNPTLTPLGLRVVQKFAESPIVNEISKTSGMPVKWSREAGYVDLSHTKESGLLRLTELHLHSNAPDWILGFIDSSNDLGICKYIRRQSAALGCGHGVFFVGKAVPSSISAEVDPSFFFHTPGGPDATAQILDALAHGSPPPVAREVLTTFCLGRSRIVADLTNTLVDQVTDRFPSEGAIASAIDAGAQFILSTGDDEQTALSYFRLRPTESAYHIVSSGGGRISEVRHGEVCQLWRCDPIPEQTRRVLLAEAVRIILSVVGE